MHGSGFRGAHRQQSAIDGQTSKQSSTSLHGPPSDLRSVMEVTLAAAGLTFVQTNDNTRILVIRLLLSSCITTAFGWRRWRVVSYSAPGSGTGALAIATHRLIALNYCPKAFSSPTFIPLDYLQRCGTTTNHVICIILNENNEPSHLSSLASTFPLVSADH